MNDYFQHLIDRSTNQAPAIRPRFPSIFEAPDVSTAVVNDDLPVEIINCPAEKKERTPAVHPGLSPTMEFPDGQVSAAIADFRSAIIHHPPEETVTSRKISDHVPSEVLSKRETSPEKNIRENTSENRMEDIKSAPASSLHTKTVGSFSNDTINSVHRETAIKNVRSQAASLDLQPSAVGNDGTNQKTDDLPATGDEVKKMAKRVSPTKAVTAASTLAPDSKHVHDSFAGVMQQPKIRPLIADSQMSPAFLPQEARLEKTIKVTIGRIEVRAVMPQSPLSQPRTVPQEPQPKISLEDYLKTQRGGSR